MTDSDLPETPTLTSAEKSAMRGMLQTMPAKVLVGKNGVTAEVLKAVELAFKHEDLIKIKFSGDRKTVKAEIEQIVSGTGAICVGGVGKVAGFYRKGEGVAAAEPVGDDDDGE